MKNRKFEVKGGLGRLCQFPKTVYVEAIDEDGARMLGSLAIRDLITIEDFGGDIKARMLAKELHIEEIRECSPEEYPRFEKGVKK